MKLPLPHRVNRYVSRAGKAVQAERIAYARSKPVLSDVVLYESFAGNGVLCNPEAIFRYLLGRPDFDHLWHVWAIDDDAALARFTDEFGTHPRVSAVRRGSFDYWRTLSTAGYLINNATFPPAFGKRPGQVYLNTWHGTPLKLMGFDMPDGAIESANTLRNLLSADYLLAANEFMAETMYEDAYRLRNVYRGQIITEGYPRIDRQRLSPAQESDVRTELDRQGIAAGERRIVLFAPTWRGSSFSNPDDDLDALAAQVKALQSRVGDDTVVLLKTHQVVHALASTRPALRSILLPNTIPTNVLLGVAAALVTDYSSIFFDYLATGRPIVFFTPDADDYSAARGTYLSLDELPGPVTADPFEAGTLVAELLEGRQHERYAQWAQRFTPYDDGEATRRVVDIVFRGRTVGRRVRPAVSDGRTRLLFFLGGMRSNGITTSVLNLLGAIDHEKYDVTALMPRFRAEDPLANRELIHPAVRQVFRIGGMNGSKALQLRRHARDRRGLPPAPRDEHWHAQLWDGEWARVFGSATFDWVADFSGYSPIWTNLLLHSPFAPRAVWLHNEMAADQQRTVAGKQPHRRALGLVFAQYGAFDHLVSVSPSLTALNRAELSAYAAPEKFVTVRNLPNVARVSEGMRAPLRSVLEADEAVPEWMSQLEQPDHDSVWFVTVGRLSTEKNHARLIRAFAQVHARDARARLLIVGAGPLEGELQQLIAELGLEGTAFLAGLRRNPFAILAAADCFVLSSTYEGQPMVLLEAALCELPIVSTAFASVRDALPGDTIRVVDQHDDALRDGMLAHLAGEIPVTRLDAAAYTSEVVAELAAVIDAGRAATATGAIRTIRRG
ncbi:glycosyltransferase [Microbacterium protaetiae]|uniref:Glycosyltransferase n=1 Tax=Microbacterium protaetiae TaxID=2509458 RepID=A0A4P6EFD9_9MICO|nr:glycosyltransferase [Microbacterium protaetiae]QAY59849.1 glycosyltransferase [Microbacterium protaetiae]